MGVGGGAGRVQARVLTLPLPANPTATETFPRPIELEFEKVYWPFLLYTKKRYAGRMFSSSPHKPDYVDVKGIQVVRRDSAPVARAALQAVLDVLMEEQDAEKALRVAKQHLLRVLDEPPGCDMAPYTMSKALRGGYKNAEQPHLYVAKKLQQRTGEVLPSGSRVPFLFVQRADSSLLGTKSSQAEHPDYAREQGMRIDRLYYVEQQLHKPMVSLLEVVDDKVEQRLFGDPDIAERIAELESGKKAEIREQKRVKYIQDNKLRPITDFFKKQQPCADGPSS